MELRTDARVRTNYRSKGGCVSNNIQQEYGCSGSVFTHGQNIIVSVHGKEHWESRVSENETTEKC